MDRNIGDHNFIGQDKLISTIDTWSVRNTFPHFMLAVGDKGCGRKSLCYLMSKVLDSSMAVIDNVSVDSMRNMIEIAYTIDSKILYVVPDADTMSIAAKNSLLKLTEEPPENAYVVITLQSLDNTLPTLRSRSQHLMFEPYTSEQLFQLCNNKLMSDIATTPGMIKTMLDMGEAEVNRLVSACDKLVNFIDKVSIANALKSSNLIKFAESDKGFELSLMIAGIEYALSQHIENNDDVYKLCCWYRCLSKYKPMLTRIGVNKKAVYDQFIFELRKHIRQGG